MKAEFRITCMVFNIAQGAHSEAINPDDFIALGQKGITQV
jgi:hypothetical protein